MASPIHYAAAASALSSFAAVRPRSPSPVQAAKRRSLPHSHSLCPRMSPESSDGALQPPTPAPPAPPPRPLARRPSFRLSSASSCFSFSGVPFPFHNRRRAVSRRTVAADLSFSSSRASGRPCASPPPPPSSCSARGAE